MKYPKRKEANQKCDSIFDFFKGHMNSFLLGRISALYPLLRVVKILSHPGMMLHSGQKE